MGLSLIAESWLSISLIFLLAVTSSFSDPDSSTLPKSGSELYEDMISHLAGNNPWDNSTFEPPRDWLQHERPCPIYPLLEDMFNQYMSIPHFSHTLTHDDACQSLDVDKQELRLHDYSEFLPRWIMDATMAGECPWHLVRREFMHGTLPPAILEVKCLCDGHRCSVHGDFKCISVKKQVMVWSTEGTGGKFYQPRFLMVTAACVCAQRHAQQTTNINAAVLWK